MNSRQQCNDKLKMLSLKILCVSQLEAPLHYPPGLRGYLTFSSQGIAKAPHGLLRRFIFLSTESTGADFSWQMPHPRHCQVVKYPTWVGLELTDALAIPFVVGIVVRNPVEICA